MARMRALKWQDSLNNIIKSTHIAVNIKVIVLFNKF